MASTYDKQGKPISWFRYARLLFNEAYKRVDYTELASRFGPITITTVWIGLDMNPARAHKPHVFETKIQFGVDSEIHRYPTLAEAVKGHSEIVDDLRRRVGA